MALVVSLIYTFYEPQEKGTSDIGKGEFSETSIRGGAVNKADSTSGKPDENLVGVNQAYANKVSEARKRQQEQLAARLLPKSPTPVDLSDRELDELRRASQEKKKEIDLLMAQYDLSRGQESQRAAIKAQMKSLMDEYNEMILPLALKEMAKEKKG